MINSNKRVQKGYIQLKLCDQVNESPKQTFDDWIFFQSSSMQANYNIEDVGPILDQSQINDYSGTSPIGWGTGPTNLGPVIRHCPQVVMSLYIFM
jgi:hypothetical protein